jgi:SAM-dependent methyltransferase
MSEFSCRCCLGKEGNIIYSGLTSVYSSSNWSVTECSNCRNILTIPVPDRKLLEDIYSNTYLYPVHHLILSEKRMRAKSLAKHIGRNTAKGKTIFEAGCMYGYLLSELKDEYKVKGIEIDEEAVDFCKRNHLDVEDSSLEDYLINHTDKFDVIILSHVFEHLLSCDEVLQKLSDRITDDGKIILLVPNSNSLSRKLFGRYWGWWQTPVHINHFSLNPLNVLAKRLGLKITANKTNGGDSLMLLLNFINLFRFHKKNSPGHFQKIIIRIWTAIFRYWYYFGNEELMVVIQKE